MERFVVGSGRCGSTLLSKMLGGCPTTLSLCEFFTGLDWGRRFETDPVDGPGLADLLSWEQAVVTDVTRRGYDVPEITYPFERGGRYGRDQGLPWLLVAMLPPLSDDPDALYDALLAFARERPRAPLCDHYRALFEWLAERLGRRHWVERSGSSVEYLASLHALFPRARFVHLHRDGREVALSMREHAPYRLAVSLLYGWRPPGLGADDDLVGAVLESRPPVALFGRYWSDQIVRGFRALPALDADQMLDLRFEELVRAPRRALERLADFLELGTSDTDWIGEAAARVRGVPATRFEKLAAPEQETLSEACRPGLQLLGRTP